MSLWQGVQGALYAYPRTMVDTLRISAPTVLEALRGDPPNHPLYDRRLEYWSRKLIEHAGIDIEVHGREHIVQGDSYVVMSNHQSHYDIPVLFQALQVPLRMVAKKELFQVPIWGQAMRASGFVELDRGNRDKAIESLEASTEKLSSGICVWIAPEGTRSRDGKLGPFKSGGFRLALSGGTKILPVSIRGTREVLRKGTASVYRGRKVEVWVGSPIDAPAYGLERRQELSADVRAAIAKYM